MKQYAIMLAVVVALTGAARAEKESHDRLGQQGAPLHVQRIDDDADRRAFHAFHAKSARRIFALPARDRQRARFAETNPVDSIATCLRACRHWRLRLRESACAGISPITSRSAAALGSASTTKPPTMPPPGSSDSSTSGSTFGIQAMVEWHMTPVSAISPYVGGGVQFNSYSVTLKPVALSLPQKPARQRNTTARQHSLGACERRVRVVLHQGDEPRRGIHARALHDFRLACHQVARRIGRDDEPALRPLTRDQFVLGHPEFLYQIADYPAFVMQTPLSKGRLCFGQHPFMRIGALHEHSFPPCT